MGTLYTGIARVGAIGNTWEGHQYNRDTYGPANLNAYISATLQYGKFGARCVRPADAY